MADNDLSSAFGDLELRAAENVGRGSPDRISLREHVVEVEIGAFQSERDTKQRISFSIVVEVQDTTGAENDDVDRILSYDTLTGAVAAELQAERLNLLETLAERIADRILIEPQAARVFVQIEKLDRGPGKLGVEIMRTKSDLAMASLAGRASNQLIVVLSRGARESDLLSVWIDQLAKAGQGVVIVPQAAEHAIKSNDLSAQFRIDLLAMEQAAWDLAGIEPRCVVIETRTELEHAALVGLVAVWAPSKLIMDAVVTPKLDALDPTALANWLAGDLGARSVATLDAETPSDLTNLIQDARK